MRISSPAAVGPKDVGLGPATAVVRRQHLDLVRELVAAQVRQRDQSSLLGFGWSFLHPLLLLALLYTFFHVRLGQDVDHYAIFLLVGLVHYTHFSNSISSAGHSLLSMSPLTKDTIFPKSLLVFAAVIAGSVEFVFSMLICLAVAALAGVQLTPAIALLPLVMLIQGWTVLWISMLVSCGFVFARDTDHLLQVFLRALFLATPIFYSPELLGDGLARTILQLNPLAHFIEWSRILLLGGGQLPLTAILALGAVNLAGTCVAVSVFQRCEPSFAERL